MATRNLTRQFVQLRAQETAKVLRRKNIVSHRHREAEEKSLDESVSQEVTSVAIAPEWVEVVNGTNRHVARIKVMRTWLCAGAALEEGSNVVRMCRSCSRETAHESPHGASMAPSPSTSRRLTT
jgi:hypothetical protein